MNRGKVLLAMSGGVDSSMAAILLKEEGFQVTGVTYRSWDSISNGCMEKETGCCSVDAIFEAKKMAQDLGFSHHIIDFRESFRETVINNFINEYLSANTPNPCVLCNAHIKWGELLEKADELNCEYIATGHYARIRKENGRYILSKGRDPLKDQSYFLWMLSQDNLKRTFFPIGEYEKTTIKKMALERGLVKLSTKKESQEICFIPDNDYRRFLREQVPEIIEKIGTGKFVSTDGKHLGTHQGYPFYTIGQRKGLGVAAGYPLYVVDINKESNTIVLGTREELGKKKMVLKDLILSKYDRIPDNMEVQTKIRYRSKGHFSRIKHSGNKAEIDFYEPIPAITPGQSAVFYEQNDLIGGGIIAETQH